MGKGELKPSSTAKRPSLETGRDGQRQSRKRLVLRVFAAKRKRPAVVEFTAGRVKLGGGAFCTSKTDFSGLQTTALPQDRKEADTMRFTA